MRIYLDNNATTGVDPRVLEAMLPELSQIPANPSSVHCFGREARQRLLKARTEIASFFHVKPHEVLFTSGGTEAMHLLLHHFLPPSCSGHSITSDVEHSSVYKTLENFAKRGHEISFLPAGLWGAVRPEAVQAALRPTTRLIVLSAANNETGVKHDIEAMAKIAHAAHIPFLVDGVSLLGKELFTLPQGVTAVGFSGHKFHAPKGVGFAIVRSPVKLSPLMIGGDQEYGVRAGTENLPGIVGMAKAIALLKEELPQASERMKSLRDRLEVELIERLDPVLINGQGPRIVNTCNLSFRGVPGEDLLMQLDLKGIAVSHGSACSSGALEPSRVLLNMGIPSQLARSSIRFSLSRETTLEEIERCIEVTVETVQQLRKVNS